MTRLAISVEGQTEEGFVKEVMEPHLTSLGVYVTPILIGSRGGNVSVTHACNDVTKLLYSFDYVSTLYDFYGFKGKSEDDTRLTLEAAMNSGVPAEVRSNFIPYIQSYEFEGLLFSSPAAIGEALGVENWALDVLSQFNGEPETINDSPQTAPSKRFEANTRYIKTVHGPAIAKTIGLDGIRTMCPNFDQWLQKLETL